MVVVGGEMTKEIICRVIKSVPLKGRDFFAHIRWMDNGVRKKCERVDTNFRMEEDNKTVTYTNGLRAVTATGDDSLTGRILDCCV